MTTLLLLFLLHGLFLAAVLQVVGRHVDPANGTLAGLVLVACALLLEHSLGRSGALDRYPHLAGVLTPAWFLVGPLVHRYVERFLGRRPARLGWSLLPAIAAAAWMLPFYLRPAAEKMQLYADPTWTIILFTGFWTLTGWCAHRAWLALRDAQRDTPARFEAAPWHIAWLRLLLAGLVCYAVLDFALTVSLLAVDRYPPIAGVVSLLILASLLYGVALLVVMPEGLLARSPWPGRRYRRAEIPESVASAQAEALERMMREREPWRDEGLDQARLAALLEVTPHQLSQLLSQHLGRSFSDYVNGFRVEEAKRLLRDVGARRTVLDIGMESGFGSSATFYRAFRRHAGTTPREFLAEASASNIEPIPRRDER